MARELPSFDELVDLLRVRLRDAGADSRPASIHAQWPFGGSRLHRCRLDTLSGSSASWFLTGRLRPLFWHEVWDLKVLVKVGRELPREQGAKLRADGDLDDVPRARVLAQGVPNRALGVEQGADRTAGQDPVAEVEAAGPKSLELEGGTPSHLPGVVGGDKLITLVHLARAPVAHPLQQASQAGKDLGIAI